MFDFIEQIEHNFTFIWHQFNNITMSFFASNTNQSYPLLCRICDFSIGFLNTVKLAYEAKKLIGHYQNSLYKQIKVLVNIFKAQFSWIFEVVKVIKMFLLSSAISASAPSVLVVPKKSVEFSKNYMRLFDTITRYSRVLAK